MPMIGKEHEIGSRDWRYPARQGMFRREKARDRRVEITDTEGMRKAGPWRIHRRGSKEVISKKERQSEQTRGRWKGVVFCPVEWARTSRSVGANRREGVEKDVTQLIRAGVFYLYGITSFIQTR